MNILFVIPEMYRGGAEKMVAYLAEYFATKKRSRVLIAVLNNEGSEYPIPETAKLIKMNCSSVELKTRIPVIIKIRSIVIDEKIDVIIGFSIGISELLPFATIGLTCRTVGSERSNPYMKKQSKTRRHIQNIILEKLDGMIFTTTGCRDYYSQGVIRKSEVIPNGFIRRDNIESIDLTKREKSRDIIAVGNLRKVKDYPTMINAFIIFSEKHTDFCLNIYGEGIEEHSIVRQIEELGLEDKVILHGSVKNLDTVYKESCFMIHSSKSESWCNAILEALSFGVPCIAADCDFGPREMIISERNGYLYEVGNYVRLATCMDKIIDIKDNLQEMSKNAYEDAKRFEFGIIAERYYSFAIGETTHEKPV